MMKNIFIFGSLLMVSLVCQVQADTNSTEAGNEGSALADRLDREEKAAFDKFTITPHRPTYILPFTYNSNTNSAPYEPFTALDPDADKLDDVEAKYQLSFKVPVIMDVFNGRANLWFAYTQVSYWQLYNKDRSSPFRETNYEPEVLLDFQQNRKVMGLNFSHIVLGFTHQSNGRSEPLSRSWNRIYANFILEKNNFVMFIKPWYRLPEDEKDDNNPDIEKYLGNGDFGLVYKRSDYVYSMLLRNNLRSKDNLTSVQLDWSIPVNDRFKILMQYVNGYGDGLVDYNNRNRRIGIGIMITDWL